MTDIQAGIVPAERSPAPCGHNKDCCPHGGPGAGSADIVASVDSMGCAGWWRIIRDAYGNQIGREQIIPDAGSGNASGADTRIHHRPETQQGAPRQSDTADFARPGRPSPQDHFDDDARQEEAWDAQDEARWERERGLIYARKESA